MQSKPVGYGLIIDVLFDDGERPMGATPVPEELVNKIADWLADHNLCGGFIRTTYYGDEDWIPSHAVVRTLQGRMLGKKEDGAEVSEASGEGE